MEKQEIDKLLAECKKITDDFKSSLQLAVDENGQPIFRDKLDEFWRVTGEKKQLLKVTTEQIKSYLNDICQICTPDILEALKSYNRGGIIDCSYLYVVDYFNLDDNKYLTHTDFRYTIFSEKVSLYKITFNGDVYFKGVVFSKNIFFHVVKFKSASFNDVKFNNWVCFDDVEFIRGSNPTSFEGITFVKGVDFKKVTFNGPTNFTNVTFSEGAVFTNDTEFRREADFRGAKFIGPANFSNSKFFNTLRFDNAVFRKVAKFYNTEFSFSNLKETSFTTWFINTKFLDETYFDGAIFNGSSNFNNAKFKNTTTFENTKFTSPPQFHNAELHPDTSFGQPENIARNFGRCETQEDYMAYRTLKQHMSNVHAKLEESMFFALEQRTKRDIDGKDFLKNWSNYLISLFYDHISGYGQNTARPIIILLISGFIIFPAIYWALDDILGRSIIVNVVKELKEQNLWGWYQSLPVHLGYSLQSIFNPLVFFNKDSAFIATNPLIRFVSSIQSMFTIAVFALWLLAVRNRFQKGS